MLHPSLTVGGGCYRAVLSGFQTLQVFSTESHCTYALQIVVACPKGKVLELITGGEFCANYNGSNKYR